MIARNSGFWKSLGFWILEIAWILDSGDRLVSRLLEIAWILVWDKFPRAET